MFKELSIEEINNKKPQRSLLTAVQRSGFKIVKSTGRKKKLVLFKCDCGNETTIYVGDFISGNTLSCGCLIKEMSENGLCNRKYYPHINRLHNIFIHMIQRCYDPKCLSYPNYGGRGVLVCDAWRFDYQVFLDWSLANGYSDKLQLDKDIKGNGLLYSPENCMWATAKQQANNKRTSVKYDYNGTLLTIYEIAELEQLSVDRIAYFIYRKKTDIFTAVEKSKLNTKIYEQRNVSKGN